ncbi:MAG: hypothetical protein ACYSWZ_01815 [Planctomycetota bacterium]|jgi:hypothetical protein
MEMERIRRRVMVMFLVVWVIVSIITGQTVFLEASDDTYIVVDDMEDYNDRDDIREVWTDGNQGGSSGSNLNVSTAVGSPYQGSIAPIHDGNQAMILRYDNDGLTYTGLPGEEKWIYNAPYYSEIEANTVGNNSLNIGQNWAATGFKELSLWFQGHPISEGDYNANAWPAYTLKGRGRDIGGRHDEFYFLGQYPFVGDGVIQVQVYSIDNTDPWAKAGVMIREKLTPYSKFAAVFVTPGNGVVFQYRDVEDGPTTSITKPGVTAPQHVRLVRNINGAFEAHHSANGFVWEDVNAPGSAPVFPIVAMGTIDDPNLYAGSAVTSHNANQICSADFNNVMVNPVPPNWIFGNIGTNDPEQLYVALSDGVNTSVVAHNDACAVTLTSWQEWNIPLTAFTGVDFNSIKKVYIGLGYRANPVVGGSGTVYIDDIRGFTIPDYKASSPNPPNEAVIAESDVPLSWLSGFGVEEHDVYMGTSWEDVNNAVYDPINPPPEYLGTATEPSFMVTGLSDNTTYYWRVDEVSGRIPGGGTYYKGDVWSFTIFGSPVILIQGLVDFDPDILNLSSQGNLITAYIGLPEEYNVADIDPGSILLEGEIEPQQFWLTGDQQIAIVRFARSDVQAILEVGDVELTITGQLTDGTLFEAKDTIEVVDNQ